MDQALQNLLELSRDPMFALADGKISVMNAAARSVFPDLRVGDLASAILPELILSNTADSFYSTAVLRGVSYTVSALRSDGVLYLSLAAEKAGAALRGCMNDSMMSGMLSALFNIGLSADRLREVAAAAGAKEQEYLHTLYHSYYILNRRLGNLNMLCSLREGSMGIVLRHTDLVTLCRELVSSVRLLLGERLARVEFDTELESLPAIVDASKVERLLLNLLSNSLEHTPPDGLVRLRLGSRGGNALLTVSDNGCGIPPAQLNSVFHSFENRVGRRSLSQEGGGIGLALCSVIAEKHGGTLLLESREGEGTTVQVMLPLSPPGSNMLRSDSHDQVDDGMTLLLTELSELLRSEGLAPFLPD